MQKIRGCRSTVPIFVSLAVMAVCGVEFAPAGHASPGDACELLTLSDVQGVLGNGFTPRHDLPLTGQTPTMANCAYSKGGDTAVVINVSQIIYDAAQYLKMEQSGIEQQGGAVTVTPVGGLGEGAFYFLDPSHKPPVFQLHFGKGNRAVILEVVTGGKPDIDAAQRLAKIVYPRLR